MALIDDLEVIRKIVNSVFNIDNQNFGVRDGKIVCPYNFIITCGVNDDGNPFWDVSSKTIPASRFVKLNYAAAFLCSQIAFAKAKEIR